MPGKPTEHAHTDYLRSDDFQDDFQQLFQELLKQMAGGTKNHTESSE
jgi:hypothetical protein